MPDGLVERSALHPKACCFESRDHVVDRLRVASLTFDFDHRVFGRQPGENPAVIDLDDVDPGLVDLGGDGGERARLIMRSDVQPRDPPLPYEVADEDV